MPQTNVQVAQRYAAGSNGLSLTRGGNQERKVTMLCDAVITLAQLCEAFFQDGTDKTNMMTGFDQMITYFHTAGGKLPN